jgi:hypothetical protein
MYNMKGHMHKFRHVEVISLKYLYRCEMFG